MTTQLIRSTRRLFWWATAVLLAGISLTHSTNTALAHTRVEVGQFALVVGWVQEPPIIGERNALYIEVIKEGVPFDGAEEGLNVEVLYGERTWRVNMNPTGTPGVYHADLFPTVRGQYTARFFGTLEGTAIDVQVDPEEVFPASNLHFPLPLPDPIALQEQIDQLQSELQTARTWAFVGAGGGALGILLGLAGLLRRKPG